MNSQAVSSAVALVAGDDVLDVPVSKIEYHDATLSYSHDLPDDPATEALLSRFHNVTKTSPASPLNGNQSSKTAYSAMVVLAVEHVAQALSRLEAGFDAVVRWQKIGWPPQCDTLLDCRPLLVVGNEVVCRASTVLWNGRPPFGRDEAAVKRSEAVVTMTRPKEIS